MESKIQIFNNPSFGEIRTAGTPENPVFCLVDICKALDLTTSKVVQRLSSDVLSKYPTIDGLGREQLTNFVNEDGLYDVILDSRKPEARSFRKWITSEVLPSIRKHGGYLTMATLSEIIANPASALDLVKGLTEELGRSKQRIQMLSGENESLAAENKVLAPKAQYTDEVLQSTETYTFVEMAKELGFQSVNRFIAKLVEKQVVFKQSGTYLLYSRYAGRGLESTRTHRFFRTDGSIGTSTRTVWTEKGRMWLHEFFHVGIGPVDFTDVKMEAAV